MCVCVCVRVRVRVRVCVRVCVLARARMCAITSRGPNGRIPTTRAAPPDCSVRLPLLQHLPQTKAVVNHSPAPNNRSSRARDRLRQKLISPHFHQCFNVKTYMTSDTFLK